MKTDTADIGPALKAAEIIKVALDGLAGKRGKLLATAQELKDSIVLLYAMPVQHAERRQAILDDIDALAASFPERAGWRTTLATYADPQGPRPGLNYPVDVSGQTLSKQIGPLNLADLVFVDSRSGGGGLNYLACHSERDLLRGDGSAKGTKAEMLEVARLAFFFGDTIKEKIAAYFDQPATRTDIRYPAGASEEDKALTIDQRLERIDARQKMVKVIDAELIAIDQQLVSLPGVHVAKKEAAYRLGVPQEIY